MKRPVSLGLALVLALATRTVLALPGTFHIDEIYSNRDGTIQYVVIRDDGQNDCDSGENKWAGQLLVSTGPGPQQNYTFPHDLSTCRTSGKRMLIGTEGFAALGIVAPDFVIPNHFVQIPQGFVIFGNMTSVGYTALPSDGIHAIDESGNVIPNVATNFAGQSGSVVPSAVQPVNVVEYYNAVLDHYFITWVAAEQANLDAGNTPTRWMRTGYSFRAYTTAEPGTSPVCRYYLPPAYGDSHFFGRGTVECDATGLAHPAFVLEDPLFMDVFLPAAGVCASGTTPIYRVFSNRADANHRYMTDRTVRDQMVARGWLAEGDGPDLVVMCGV
jgi:hypothetical protein